MTQEKFDLIKTKRAGEALDRFDWIKESLKFDSMIETTEKIVNL